MTGGTGSRLPCRTHAHSSLPNQTQRATQHIAWHPLDPHHDPTRSHLDSQAVRKVPQRLSRGLRRSFLERPGERGTNRGIGLQRRPFGAGENASRVARAHPIGNYEVHSHPNPGWRDDRRTDPLCVGTRHRIVIGAESRGRQRRPLCHGGRFLIDETPLPG